MIDWIRGYDSLPFWSVSLQECRGQWSCMIPTHWPVSNDSPIHNLSSPPLMIIHPHSNNHSPSPPTDPVQFISTSPAVYALLCHSTAPHPVFPSAMNQIHTHWCILWVFLFSHSKWLWCPRLWGTTKPSGWWMERTKWPSSGSPTGNRKRSMRWRGQRVHQNPVAKHCRLVHVSLLCSYFVSFSFAPLLSSLIVQLTA